MKKPLKITIFVFSGLGFLLSMTFISLQVLINPNVFKPEIIGLIKQRTGRELHIVGDLAWSIFPELGIKVGRMTLSNAEKFADKDFAVVSAAEMRLEWLPLLAQKLHVSKLQLQGLQLNLGKTPQGDNNWNDILLQFQALPENTQPPQAPEVNLERLVIKDVLISDAHVLWDDQQAARKLEFSVLHFATALVSLDQPIALDVIANINADINYAVKMGAVLSLDNAFETFKVPALNMDIVASGPTLPTAGIAINGKINDLEYHPKLHAFNLPSLQLRSGAVSVDANFKGQNLQDQRSIKGAVRVAEFDLIQSLKSQAVPVPVMPDVSALTRCAAQLDLQVNDRAVQLQNIRVMLDQSTLTGSATVDTVESPVITFSAAIDTLNVDRYFTQAAKVPVPELSSAVVIAAADKALPFFERLKKIPLNGQLLLQQLQINQLKVEAVSVLFSENDRY